MAEFIGNTVSKVEPLTGNNYHIWALKVASILKGKRLYKPIIEGVEAQDIGNPGSVERKARDKWEEQNDDAFGILILTLSAEQAALFINETNAKKVWLELKDTYAGNVEDRKIDAMMELKELKMREDEMVDAFITRAKCAATKCATLGLTIQSRELVYHIVRGLNSKMSNIGSILRTQRSATLEEIQQSLAEEELRIEKASRYKNDHSEKAYRVKDNHRGMKNHVNNKRCYGCGKMGHLISQCFHRKPIEKESSGRQQFAPTNTNFKRNGKNYERKYEYAKVASDTTVEQAFEANEKYKNFERNTNWNLDSGCTSHMTPYVDWITDLQPVTSEVNLASEGNQIEVKGKGHVMICTATSEGIKNNICIHNVLYVPKLRSNLLSVRSLIEQGNQVIFNKNGATITNNNGDIIAEATETNRMYIMKANPRVHLEEKTEMECMNVEGLHTEKIKLTDIEKWHKRLGHVNQEYMRKMKDLQMVRGLDFKDKSGNNKCDSCVMGKLTRNTFNSIECDGTSKTLELLHMDLCGPMPEISLGGSRYMYVIIDAFSRRIFVYFLGTKSEAFDRFLEFKNRRENETGNKIVRIRSDNGGEFVNDRFNKLLTSEGIHHEKTTFYTPQSNGVVERSNRTIVERARTMLIDSNLPNKFWAEAMATAVHTYNRTPTKHGKEKTPIELWTGTIPSVAYLKTFGCVSYYCIPKEQRSKLDPKAKKGIFIGYATNRKAYRIYNVEDCKVIETRDVKFDEEVKGDTLLKNNPKMCEDKSNGDSKDREFWLPDTDFISMENQLALEQENPEQDILNIQQAVRKPGRRRGDTDAVLQERQKEQREENERELLAMGVRRSDRLREVSNQANMISNDKQIPKSYKEIDSLNLKSEWHQAMDEEINSLQRHNVWTLVPREREMKVIKNKWIYSIKENPDGTIYKRKARLVATGYNTSKETRPEDSFSPVMKLESFRTLMAIAAHKKMVIRQYDVKTAYLNAEIKGKVFMEQPKGYKKRAMKMKCAS